MGRNRFNRFNNYRPPLLAKRTTDAIAKEEGRAREARRYGYKTPEFKEPERKVKWGESRLEKLRRSLE